MEFQVESNHRDLGDSGKPVTETAIPTIMWDMKLQKLEVYLTSDQIMKLECYNLLRD